MGPRFSCWRVTLPAIASACWPQDPFQIGDSLQVAPSSLQVLLPWGTFLQECQERRPRSDLFVASTRARSRPRSLAGGRHAYSRHTSRQPFELGFAFGRTFLAAASRVGAGLAICSDTLSRASDLYSGSTIAPPSSRFPACESGGSKGSGLGSMVARHPRWRFHHSKHRMRGFRAVEQGVKLWKLQGLVGRHTA